MNLSCSVIRDLLPLYVENIASQDSAVLIEAHQKTCAACAEEYAQLLGGTPQILPAQSPAAPLKQVKKELRRKKRNAICFIALAVFLVMFVTFSYLTTPVYAQYHYGLITIGERENGELVIEFDTSVTSYRTVSYTDENQRKILQIEAWTSTYDKWVGKSLQATLPYSDGGPVEYVIYDGVVPLNLHANDIDIIYYCDNANGGELTAVYGRGNDDHAYSLPRLVLSYYVVIGAAAAVVLGVLWLLCRKTKFASSAKYLFLAPCAYLIGTVLIKGFDFISFSITRDFFAILIASAAVYGMLAFGIALLKQRADRR